MCVCVCVLFCLEARQTIQPSISTTIGWSSKKFGVENDINDFLQDRILVPESSTSCGDVSTAHDLAFRTHLCGRGDATCVSTAGNGPPTSYENMGHIVGHIAAIFGSQVGVCMAGGVFET